MKPDCGHDGAGTGMAGWGLLQAEVSREGLWRSADVPSYGTKQAWVEKGEAVNDADFGDVHCLQVAREPVPQYVRVPARAS